MGHEAIAGGCMADTTVLGLSVYMLYRDWRLHFTGTKSDIRHLIRITIILFIVDVGVHF
jgi:hypothetical protein